MPEPRLATGFWVQAYLRHLSMYNIPAYVTAHGDDTAGAVIVKLATLDGQAKLFQRRYDLNTGQRRWDETFAGAEHEADAQLRRQASTDPDLWTIEVEDRAGRHLLDDPALG